MSGDDMGSTTNSPSTDRFTCFVLELMTVSAAVSGVSSSESQPSSYCAQVCPQVW